MGLGTTTNHTVADRWLARVTAFSLSLAALALIVFLWAKWGLVVAMSRDVLKYCF